MTRFTSSTRSEAVITAERDRVWEMLTDPDTVARLTPLLQRIEVDGDLWIWHMGSIPGLPVRFAPTFTERMHQTPKERIEYEHAPRGGKEPAAVKGWYALEDHPEGVKLGIYLEICVALPLPKMAGGMVQGVMGQVMGQMGDRFAKRMMDELGAHEVPV
jgi:carbon monoxide dehydrogenase subunit G